MNFDPPVPVPAEDNDRELRLAMLGMIEGNAHPYSWSAIVNGYDPTAMQEAIGDRYPVILDYLAKQPAHRIGIPGTRVTHVWTDDPGEALRLAAAAQIPHVLQAPEDAIGEVDAAIVATDDGDDHAERARPFIEAGLPVFIDKPLATNLPDLRRFIAWEREGKPILSSSGLRYSPELAPLQDLDEIRWITGTMIKTWERYGVHALEPIFTLTGPGFLNATTHQKNGNQIVTLQHRKNMHATIAILPDSPGSSATIHAYGTKEDRSVKMTDTFTAFRNQMLAFIEFVRSGKRPYAFSETIEIMLILIAAILSRDEGGKTIQLDELREKLR